MATLPTSWPLAAHSPFFRDDTCLFEHLFHTLHMPVLYKYWPLPTCMFSSLVISLLLVISVHSKKLSSLSTRTSALNTPWLLSLNTLADLQLITTQHWPSPSTCRLCPRSHFTAPQNVPLTFGASFPLGYSSDQVLQSFVNMQHLWTSLTLTYRPLEPFSFVQHHIPIFGNLLNVFLLSPTHTSWRKNHILTGACSPNCVVRSLYLFQMEGHYSS